MKSIISLVLALMLMTGLVHPVAGLAYIDVSIGGYDTDLLVGEDVTIPISIGLEGETGDVIAYITPSAGFTCTQCTQQLYFNQSGEIILTSFTLTAVAPGVYSQPFSVTAYLVANPDIRDTKFAPLPIEVRSPECGVDVFDLDVQDDVVSVAVRNTGELEEEIQNIVYIDGESVRVDNLILQPGEAQEISFVFEFTPGSHVVRSTATAACGAEDTEQMVHVVLHEYVCQNPPGIEGQNRCDFVNHQYLVCTASGWQVLGTNDQTYCTNCAYGTCGDGILNCGETAETCPQDAPNGNGNGIPEEVCKVRVRDIDESSFVSEGYETHIIEAIIENLGTEDEDIDLELFIDGFEDKDEDFELSPGEARTFLFYVRGLARGEHAAEVSIEADCGSHDSDFVLFFSRGVPIIDIICALSIEAFDFMERFNEDQTGVASFDIRNTGTIPALMTVALLLNGEPVDFIETLVPVDAGFAGDLFYTAGPGAHLLTLEATAECGASDFRTETIVVNRVMGGVAPPPEFPTAPIIITTTVVLRPQTFDVEIYSSKVITLEILSAEDQTFLIEVTGLPEDWIDFQEEIEVERGTTTTFMYLTPREIGTYTPTVTVTAVEEALEFTFTPDFFVPVPQEEPELDFMGWFIVSLTANSFIIALTTLIIIGVIVVYAGRKKLVMDDDFQPYFQPHMATRETMRKRNV